MQRAQVVIVGVPISSQATTKKKREWKNTVFRSAVSQLGLDFEPFEVRLHVSVDHYYIGGTIDLDNLAKPLLDALKGVAYTDDGLIDSLHLRRFDLDLGVTFSEPSADVSKALETERDFVIVQINELISPGAKTP